MQSTDNPFKEGTEETKQELPDASDDSDAFDPRVLDGTLEEDAIYGCLLYTSPSPRDMRRSRMPSSA